MQTRLARSWTVIVGSLVATAICGCSSHQESAQKVVGLPVKDVGTIIVTVSDKVDPDDQQIFKEVDGTPRLKQALEKAVANVAKLNAVSPRVLEVQVTGFRLRSGATVFWAGVMAGVDTLDVDVAVRDGQQITRSYTTGVGSSGIAGGLTSSSRFQPMADVVAERVADEL